MCSLLLKDLSFNFLFKPSSVTVPSRLCRTWLETQKSAFLALQLIKELTSEKTRLSDSIINNVWEKVSSDFLNKFDTNQLIEWIVA